MNTKTIEKTIDRLNILLVHLNDPDTDDEQKVDIAANQINMLKDDLKEVEKDK